MSKSSCVINPPTEEENKAALEEFFAEDRKRRNEGREAVTAAIPALERLCEVMRGRSGQCYKVRALLYSLWNGQPASLEIWGQPIEKIQSDFQPDEAKWKAYIAEKEEHEQIIEFRQENGITSQNMKERFRL